MAIKKNIKKVLSVIGPGLFLIGYNIGTGSITSMAKAGAEYSMTLFWALVLSSVFTYILMVSYGHVTLVTGNTALFNIKNEFKFGKVLAIYIFAALVIGELLALMGIMGLVAELIQEGISLIIPELRVSTFLITSIIVVLLFMMLWKGQYLFFEKVLTVFVIIMALTFIIVFILVKPDLGEIFSGLVPSIQNDPGNFKMLAAIVGTTCSAAVFIMRSTIVAEKGWTINDLDKEKKDAFISASTMLLLSGIIMAVGAGTLHTMGMKLNNSAEMINLFEPIGGKAAAIIFIVGIVGAGLSTVFPIILIAPWLMSDYSGKVRNLKSPLYRALGAVGLLFAFGMQFMKQSPPLVIVFSQAFQAMILPAVAIPIFILINRKELMKEHVPSLSTNIGIVLVILFSLLTAYFAIAGIS